MRGLNQDSCLRRAGLSNLRKRRGPSQRSPPAATGGGRPRRPACSSAVGGAKGVEHAPGARAAIARGAAAVEFAGQRQDGGEHAAVDADANAGQGQVPSGPSALSSAARTSTKGSIAAEGGEGGFEQAESLFAQRAEQVARAQLAGLVQLADQPPFHVLLFGAERRGGKSRAVADTPVSGLRPPPRRWRGRGPRHPPGSARRSPSAAIGRPRCRVSRPSRRSCAGGGPAVTGARPVRARPPPVSPSRGARFRRCRCRPGRWSNRRAGPG